MFFIGDQVQFEQLLDRKPSKGFVFNSSDLEEYDGVHESWVYSCPKGMGLVHDFSGIYGRACNLYVVPKGKQVLSMAHADRDEVQKMRDYLGNKEKLAHVTLDFASGPWFPMAQIDAIRYRRSDQKGYFRHEYARRVHVYKSRGAPGYRLPLPDGCQINARGIVWPLWLGNTMSNAEKPRK